MKYDLPPLSSLRAFEASARRESFTRAAEELNLTQAAVSFQVRKLEEALRVRLFTRSHRALSPTPEARALAIAVRQAFSTLDAAKRTLSRPRDRRTVSISAPTSLSAKWLVPRLNRLQEPNGRIRLRLDATDRLIDLESDEVDLAIRYAPHPPAETRCVLLFVDAVFPVCSPAYLERAPSLARPADIAAQTLLHDQMADFGWPDWFAAVGVDRSEATGGHRFSHTGIAIDAAIAGEGVALGRTPLVVDDLAAGRLIKPFEITGTSRYAYYLLSSAAAAGDPAADVAAQGLLGEAEKTIEALR